MTKRRVGALHRQDYRARGVRAAIRLLYSLLHLQPSTGAVAVELRGVHALDIRDAGLITAAMEHLYRILKDVGALGKIVDEEVA